MRSSRRNKFSERVVNEPKGPTVLSVNFLTISLSLSFLSSFLNEAKRIFDDNKMARFNVNFVKSID